VVALTSSATPTATKMYRIVPPPCIAAAVVTAKRDFARKYVPINLFVA